MDQSLSHLLIDMLRVARNGRLVPASKALAQVTDQATKAGALRHGRYPILLDEASAAEYELRGRKWLEIVRRVFDETRTPWSADSSREALHLITLELNTDWEEILGRLRGKVPAGTQLHMDQLDSAKDRTRSYLEHEFAILVLREDRGRVPLADRLAADRYRVARAAWAKAQSLLSSSPTDLANAAKEATGAVEALARVVTGQPSATLGDAIKTLRTTKNLEAPLLKGVEELWGWASNEPGVRHSGVEEPLDLARVRYIFALAQGALELLLALDVPYTRA